MCELSMPMEHSRDNYDHQMKHILSENLRMIPDDPKGSKESDIYGTMLHVDEEDNNPLHIKEHNAFIKANTLRTQYKSKMEAHIKKHEIAEKEKQRMGIKEKSAKIEEGEY